MTVTIDGSASVTINSGAVLGLTSSTVQTAPPATPQYFDFTSIPSWVKRITVMFNGVSTSATSVVQVQIASGSFPASPTTYVASAWTGGSGNTGQSLTSGFPVDNGSNQGAATIRGGTLVISNITGNTWVAQGNVGRLESTQVCAIAGYIALGGVLDRLRITTVNGTDTFDAGTINILYE